MAEMTGLASSRNARGATRVHRMPYGAEVLPYGGVRFRLWAPALKRVRLRLDGEHAELEMNSVGEGWHEVDTHDAAAGTRYDFVLPDGQRIPDPASRYQPNDVHGPSEVIDPAAYTWRSTQWAGRPWREAVVYELHIGAFTPEGAFRAAIDKLDHLQALGVTALEIMPVADFPGKRNWGYDGVLLFAPDSSYGRPEDFKALIDAAHQRGLMVLLDVVYNHFGPEGNYLNLYAPQFFNSRHTTPWGAAVNYDAPFSRIVRDFAIHNALYWLHEFHLDGLRLDAIHAIIDDSARDLIAELAETVRAEIPDRHIHLILENEENSASRLTRNLDGSPRLYTAQWNDDVHHALHVAASGEDAGYYADYHGDTAKLGRALAEGFAFQGEVMNYRGSERGEPSAHLAPDAFVAFIQNHDQIGNRAFGERISALTTPEALRAITAVYLLLPQIPMLFMGEEWNAREPFPFFCDFSGELADAVRNGRREEFARFPEFQDPARRSEIPDPQAAETFEHAKLRWEDLDKPEHSEWLGFYRRLLDVRRREVLPLNFHGNCGTYKTLDDSALVVRWSARDGRTLTLAANLSGTRVPNFPQLPASRVIWQEGNVQAGRDFGPWAIRWLID